jgi:POT family proton-dependent oligopeptide transporter
VLGVRIAAGQVQTLDALLVLALIPLFAIYLFPALERRGVRVTALRKMAVGMFVMVLSFVAAAFVQWALEAGRDPHVAWQIPQYVFLAVGEVLVSVTALEFAYAQAPAQLKSLVMGLWYLTIWAGSFLTAVVAWLNRFQGVAYYVFFAALMLAAAVIFAFVAWWYRPAQAAGASRAAA